MSRAIGTRAAAAVLAVVMAAPAQLGVEPVAAAEPSLTVDVSWTRPGSSTVLMESGGSWRPFTTNFPHMSWAPMDFLGAATASFGVPITFAAAPGATRACRYAYSGDWGNALEVRPLDYETCPSWGVTIPDLRPEPFRAGDLVTPMHSTFASESGTYDATLDRYIAGSMSTELDWSPTAGTGSFATNLPAVTWPEATTPRYAVVGQPVSLVPRIDSTPDGSYCRLNYSTPDMAGGEVVELEQPVSGGACAGVTVTPTTTGTLGAFVQLHRADREPLGWSGVAVEIIEPMPAPVVVAPPTVVEGDPVAVTGSVGTGVPMAYAISLAPSTSATSGVLGVTAAAGTCAAGSLDPRLEQSSANATCTAGTPGSYQVGPVAARDRGPVLLVKAGSVPAATMNELKRLKPKKIIVLGGTSVIGQSVATALGSIAPVTRIAGVDRYDTAARLSRTFASGVPVAYVAIGTNFPDALAGGPATRGRGPLLLVSAGGIPVSVKQELLRLKPREIVVLGGTAAVSPGIVAALDAYTTGSVTRRAGANRFATSVAVSRGAFSTASVAYLAVGTNFPDALAGGPPAAITGAPMLLVTRDNVPAVVRSELVRLGVKRVVVLGGTGSISTTVIAQLKALLD